MSHFASESAPGVIRPLSIGRRQMWHVIGGVIVGADETTLHDTLDWTVVSTHQTEQEATQAARKLVMTGGYDEIDIECD